MHFEEFFRNPLTIFVKQNSGWLWRILELMLYFCLSLDPYAVRYGERKTFDGILVCWAGVFSSTCKIISFPVVLIEISVTADYGGLIEFNGCTLIGGGSLDKRTSTAASILTDIEVEFVEPYIISINSGLKN